MDPPPPLCLATTPARARKPGVRGGHRPGEEAIAEGEEDDETVARVLEVGVGGVVAMATRGRALVLLLERDPFRGDGLTLSRPAWRK